MSRGRIPATLARDRLPPSLTSKDNRPSMSIVGKMGKVCKTYHSFIADEYESVPPAGDKDFSLPASSSPRHRPGSGLGLGQLHFLINHTIIIGKFFWGRF